MAFRPMRFPYSKQPIRPEHSILVIGHCVAAEEVWVKVIDKPSRFSATGYDVDPQEAAKDAQGRLHDWGLVK